MRDRVLLLSFLLIRLSITHHDTIGEVWGGGDQHDGIRVAACKLDSVEYRSAYIACFMAVTSARRVFGLTGML